MTERIKCLQCDRMIIEVTVRLNDGLCGHCKSEKDSNEFKRQLYETIKGWKENPETLPGTNGIPMPDDISYSMAARQARKDLFPTEDDKIDDFCEEFFERAHDKWTRFGSLLLSRKEKTVLVVETFRGEVGNGGIIQFLGNEAGAFANWGDKAFRSIGVPEYAKIITDLKAMFPSSKIPKNPDRRWEIAEKLDEDLLESFDEKVWEIDVSTIRKKLYQYLNK